MLIDFAVYFLFLIFAAVLFNPLCTTKMKKNLFFAAIAAMCFASCSHDEPVATLTATVNAPDSMHTKAVCFAVSGDFQISTVPMTRAMTADGKSMTDLWVLDYSEGNLLQTIHQTSEDADFGTPTINLDYGDHTIYFVASRGSSATIDTDAKTLTFGRVSDTFWQSLALTVTSTTDASRTVTLSRIVTKLTTVITDAIPEGAATFNLTPEAWHYGIDYTTGLPISSTASKSITINIPSSEIGVTNEHLSIFGFSSEDEWTTDIALDCQNSSGAILGQAAITAAPFKRNRITSYSGPLFDRTRSMTLTLSDSWEDTYTATW